jgi:WD40 repeat protein
LGITTNGTVYLEDLSGRQTIKKEPPASGARPKSACLDPDGKTGVILWDRGFATLINFTQSLTNVSIPAENSQQTVTAAAFSHDGGRLALATSDRSLTILTLDTNTGIFTVSETIHLQALARQLNFDSAGKDLILIVTENGQLVVFDLRSSYPLTDSMRWRTPVETAAFLKGNNTIVAVTRDGALLVWDLCLPFEHAPAWLPVLAELVAGEKIQSRNPGSDSAPLSFSILKQELASLDDTNSIVAWGKWFCDDRTSRCISPSTPLPVKVLWATSPDIQLWSVDDWLRISPGNPQALSLKAKHLKNRATKDTYDVIPSALGPLTIFNVFPNAVVKTLKTLATSLVPFIHHDSKEALFLESLAKENESKIGQDKE